MTTAAAPSASTVWLSVHRRWIAAIILALAVATAVSIAIFRWGGGDEGISPAGQNIANSIGNGAKAVGTTVASLFGLRSPGERAAGTLANLKHKRLPVLHERALPKVRRLPGHAAPLAAAPAGPAGQELLPANPLYNIVGGTPEGAPTIIATETRPLLT